MDTFLIAVSAIGLVTIIVLVSLLAIAASRQP